MKTDGSTMKPPAECRPRMVHELQFTLLRRLGGGIVSVMPYGALAVAFLVSWIWPLSSQYHSSPKFLVMLIVTEFLVIIGSSFMGAVVLGNCQRATKVKAIIGLVVFLSGFIVGPCFAFKSWWPAQAFALLTIAKVLDVMTHRMSLEKDRQEFVKTFGWQICAYVAACLVACVVPMPSLGFTAEAIKQLGLSCEGGLVEREPHRAMAWGFLYFIALAAFSLYDSVSRSRTNDHRADNCSQATG